MDGNAGVRSAEIRDISGRDAMVGFCEMHQHRAARRLPELLADIGGVIAGCCIGIEPARSKPRGGAADAKSTIPTPPKVCAVVMAAATPA